MPQTTQELLNELSDPKQYGPSELSAIGKMVADLLVRASNGGLSYEERVSSLLGAQQAYIDFMAVADFHITRLGGRSCLGVGS